MQERVDRLERDLTATRKERLELQERLEALSTTNMALVSSMADREGVIEQLKQSTGSQDAMKRELDAARQTIDTLMVESIQHSVSAGDAKERDKRIQMLEQQLKLADARHADEIKDLRARLQTLEKEKTGLRDQIKTDSKANEQTVMQLQSLIQSLKDEKTALASTLTQARSTAATDNDNTAEIKSLEERLAFAEDAARKLSGLHAVAMDEKQSLKKTHVEKQTLIESLQAGMTDLQEQHRLALSDVQELKQSLMTYESAESDVAAMREELNALKMENARSVQLKSANEKTLKNLKDANESLALKLKDVKQKEQEALDAAKSSHAKAVKVLEDTWSKRLTEAHEKHQAAMDAFKTSQTRSLQDADATWTKRQHDETAKQTNIIDALRKERDHDSAEAQKKFDLLVNEKREQCEELTRLWKEDVASKESELADAHARLQKSSSDSKSLRMQITELETKIARQTVAMAETSQLLDSLQADNHRLQVKVDSLARSNQPRTSPAKVCFVCDQEGHATDECPQTKTVWCDNCEAYGHSTSQCQHAEEVRVSVMFM
jgi:uncharacterized coiled-coil protein SlyX